VSEELKLEIKLVYDDDELNCISGLAQVLEHFTNYGDVDEDAQRRIVTWFADKYTVEPKPF